MHHDALRARVAAPRVGILGPVVVGREGDMRAVRGHSARLLVGLATATGACSLDRLAELVWGDDLPRTYRAALHVHLGTLRRALAEASEGCRIARADDGYRLELDGWEVDATLATDLVTAARDGVHADPRVALELLEQAIELWRGEPFVVDGDAVDVPARHHLDTVRHEADELLVEALIAIGDASRAEAAAKRAVEAEPLRENRWGQLLRARYLAGRPADALATYQAARTTLADALAIEPGRHLRDLEAAVLTHDLARLRLPASEGDAVTAPPATGGPCIGRDAALARMTGTIATHRRLLIIGPPGVGKTRLAIEATREHAGPVGWVDLREGPGSREAALARIVDWARRTPDALVVIDNAEAAADDVRSTVGTIGRTAPAVAVIVTSQVTLGVDLSVETLQPLGMPELGAGDDAVEAAAAVQVLRAALTELAPGVTLAADDVAQLCRRAGGLPLVLRLTAAAARALPVDALMKLPVSVAGDQIDRATGALVALLTDDARDAFADLSVLPGDYDDVLGAGVAGMAPDRFAGVVLALTDQGLLQARPEQRLPYSMLEPIRTVAARYLASSGRHSAVLDRYADTCIERARALQETAITGNDSALAERLDADLPRHRRALAHLTDTRDAERALRLVCSLEAPLYTLGWWAEKVELFDEALRIPGPPSAMRARTHMFRARPGPLHMFDFHHIELAETMATELGHAGIAAFAKHLHSIGLIWAGRTDEAIELATQATEHFAAAGRTFEWGEARRYLGVALVLHGDAVDGLEMQRDVLGAARSSGNAFLVAHRLSYLGHCHHLLGDDTAALVDWTEARDTFRRIGNRGTAIHTCIGLAEIAADRGDHELALVRAGEAIELAGAARAFTYGPWTWTVAMRAHVLAGDRHAATTCARRAIDGLPRVPPGETVRLAIELAHIAVANGSLTAASRLLGVVRETDDVRELPFPAPSEHERLAAVESAVTEHLGTDAWHHINAGRHCTLAEAAGELIAS
jgi:DNA-binding SARP family transcriptional activator